MMHEMAKAALYRTAQCVAVLYVPVVFVVCIVGLIGAWVRYVAPQVFEALPLEQWPYIARAVYGLVVW